MKSKGLKPSLFYPARLSFKIEREIKSFPDKKTLKELISSKPVLKEILRNFFMKKKEKKNINILKGDPKKGLFPGGWAPCSTGFPLGECSRNPSLF